MVLQGVRHTTKLVLSLIVSAVVARLYIEESIAVPIKSEGMLGPEPWKEEPRDGGVCHQGVFFAKVVLLAQQPEALFVAVACVEFDGEEIACREDTVGHSGGDVESIAGEGLVLVDDEGIALNASVLCRLQSVFDGDEEGAVPLVATGVESIEANIGMIGILRVVLSWGIDQPKLHGGIPVGLDVLGVQDADLLLQFRAHQVCHLGEGLGRIVETGLRKGEGEGVESMKPWIPPCLPAGGEQHGPRCIPIISEVKEMGLQGYPVKKVIYTGVWSAESSCVQITEDEGDRILPEVTLLKTQ